MITVIDLSHIYHRPGDLFWKENDPFQGCGAVLAAQREIASEDSALYVPLRLRTAQSRAQEPRGSTQNG